MIEFEKHYSDQFEISLYKRDSAGNVRTDAPKEYYSTNDPVKLADFYERRVGFLERRKELAAAKERRKRQKKKKKILTRNDIESKKEEFTDGRSVIQQQKAESSG